jgi:hypothetical protein
MPPVIDLMGSRILWPSFVTDDNFGEVFFDLPASQVSESLLQQLYESERGILPKQGSTNI